MRIFFQFVFLFVSTSCFSQFYEDTVIQITRNPVYNSEMDVIGKSTKIDTIYFLHDSRRNILTGTTMLPNTHNNMSLFGAGMYLESVKGSDCMGGGEDAKNQIVSFQVIDSTLIIEIVITENCSYDFLCEAKFIEETGNLELLYTGYGQGYAACYCCFGLVYRIKIDDFEAFSKLKSIQIQDLQHTKKEFKN